MKSLFRRFAFEKLNTQVSINFEFVSRFVRAASTSFGLSFVSFWVPFRNLMCPMQLRVVENPYVFLCVCMSVCDWQWIINSSNKQFKFLFAVAKQLDARSH